MLRARTQGGRGDRGASMIAALAATMVVLGFGALSLQLVRAELRQADQRLDRNEAFAHAEYAASEGINRVINGNEGSTVQTGTVDGVDYGYTVTANGDETWTIVGRSGLNTDERTVTAEIARTVENDAAVVERYAAYGYQHIDVGYVGGGDINGPIGSGGSMTFYHGDALGTRQDHVTTCSGCPNPQVTTTYSPIVLPAADNPAACPADGDYRITGPVALGGHYDCSATGETLEISGTITMSSPVVIHLGSDTNVDIFNATINQAGHSSDFIIAKADTTVAAYRSTIDDSTVNMRILAPTSWLYVGDVTWRGTFEVEQWWLFDYATIDGTWDGDPSTGTITTSWDLTSWQLD